MEQVSQILNNLPPGFYETLGAAIVLSPLLQTIKHKVSKLSGRSMFLLVTFTSFLVAAGGYLLTTPTQDPSIIALQTAVLAFMTQPVYFFVVKPIYQAWIGILADAEKFRSEVQSATVPAEGLPILAEPLGKPEVETPIAPVITEEFN